MRKFLFLFLFLSCSPIVATQPLPYYFIVPRIGDGISRETGFKPEFLSGDSRIPSRSSMNLGLSPHFLTRALITETLRDSIAALADVIAFPLDIDSSILLSEIVKLQSDLEAIGIPADWVTTINSYKDVIKFIAKYAQILQRTDGLFKRKLY